jgi:hypothetical protein
MLLSVSVPVPVPVPVDFAFAFAIDLPLVQLSVVLCLPSTSSTVRSLPPLIYNVLFGKISVFSSSSNVVTL